jgi:hypothetical protein
MPNIKFNYRYRDRANYKNHSFVIFKNNLSVSIEELELLIKSKLIDETWFYADEWQLPELFLSFFDYKTDPTWHEFESVEYADEEPNTLLTAVDFIDIIKKIQQTRHCEARSNRELYRVDLHSMRLPRYRSQQIGNMLTLFHIH